MLLILVHVSYALMQRFQQSQSVPPVVHLWQLSLFLHPECLVCYLCDVV